MGARVRVAAETRTTPLGPAVSALDSPKGTRGTRRAAFTLFLKGGTFHGYHSPRRGAGSPRISSSRSSTAVDGTKVPAAAIPALKELCLDMLEPLRAKYGACTVLSGFRTTAHNAERRRRAAEPAQVPRASGLGRGGPEVCDGLGRRVGEEHALALGQQAGLDREGARRVRGYPSQGFVHVDSGTRRNWKG